MDTSDYKSKQCDIEFLSELSCEDAEKMIGKVIAKIEAGEYFTTLIFTDGSQFKSSGGRWDGCCIGAEFTDA